MFKVTTLRYYKIYIKYIGFIFTSSNDLKYFLKHNVPRFFKTIYDTFINYKDQVISTHVFFQDGDSGGYMRMNQVTTGNGLHLLLDIKIFFLNNEC